MKVVLLIHGWPSSVNASTFSLPHCLAILALRRLQPLPRCSDRSRRSGRCRLALTRALKLWRTTGAPIGLFSSASHFEGWNGHIDHLPGLPQWPCVAGEVFESAPRAADRGPVEFKLGFAGDPRQALVAQATGPPASTLRLTRNFFRVQTSRS
jgi:hypothetical protein